MLRTAVIGLLALLVTNLETTTGASGGLAAEGPLWQVYFSPKGGCTEAVVKALAASKTAVYVQAFSFTSGPIARALTDAARRGVKVEVILDKSQRSERYSSADFLARAGIPVGIDAAHASAHNKVMVIDGATVITGSFNFTRAAEDLNAENLLVIRDQTLASRYTENWRAHSGHSVTYVAGEATPSGRRRGGH